jgi:hypothetical protein
VNSIDNFDQDRSNIKKLFDRIVAQIFGEALWSDVPIGFIHPLFDWNYSPELLSGRGVSCPLYFDKVKGTQESQHFSLLMPIPKHQEDVVVTMDRLLATLEQFTQHMLDIPRVIHGSSLGIRWPIYLQTSYLPIKVVDDPNYREIEIHVYSQTIRHVQPTV